MKYLDYEVTKKEDSIENIFCKELEAKGKTKPMSEQETMILMHIMLEKGKGNSNSIDGLYDKVEKQSASLLILKDRLEGLKKSLDKESLILCSVFCRTPGECVMYANYIAYKMKSNDIDHLTIEDLCSNVFPFGFFTDETLEKFWDIQKVNTEGNHGSDNLLDYRKAAESIMK